MPPNRKIPGPPVVPDRLAVVTGAASGLGRALAQELHTRGARLILADIEPDGLTRTADQLNARTVVTDVADPDAMERLAGIAAQADLVCLNAGVTSTFPGQVWEAPPDEWCRVFSVNLGGVVNGLRAFIPRLLDAGRPARFLITASLAGLATWPGGGPYAASKHAVVTVAEQAALALAGTGITVTVICPALVRTAMSPIGEDPRIIAADALDAAEDGRFTVVPGEWHDAVLQRGVRLTTGSLPEVPRST